MGPFGTLVEDDGVLRRAADVNGFTVGDLRFPSGHVQPEVEPELPYLAVVVSGAMVKTFDDGLSFGAGSALTMPAGARHGASFGPRGARVVIVKARTAESGVSFKRVSVLRGPGLAPLARRLGDELRASDDAAPLAAEGLALELLAAASRSGAHQPAHAPPWLDTAEELLRARTGECVRLSDLAAELGLPAIHVARGFRAHRGMSVGEYGRRLRIEWAASELADRDRPLAEIAAEGGFADQSHFTRLFRRYVGTTPAKYRAFQAR